MTNPLRRGGIPARRRTRRRARLRLRAGLAGPGDDVAAVRRAVQDVLGPDHVGAEGFLEERDLAPAGLTVRLGDRANGAVVLDQDEPVTIELGLFGDVPFLVARLGQVGDLVPKISAGHAGPVLLEETLTAVLEDLIDRLGSPERLEVVEQSLRELLIGPRQYVAPTGADAVDAAATAPASP